MRFLYNKFKEENRQQKAEKERLLQEAKNLETQQRKMKTKYVAGQRPRFMRSEKLAVKKKEKKKNDLNQD